MPEERPRGVLSAEELMSILDAIPDVLFWCRYDAKSATSRIEWCNDTVVEATGMAREEIIGRRPGDLLPPNPLSDRAVRRDLYERAKRFGVQEFEEPVPFHVGDTVELMRIRVVWVTPGDNRVLILARPVASAG